MSYSQTELETLNWAERTARELIAEHLGPTWRFKWNNRKRSFGMCSYSDKTIQLSRIMTANQKREDIMDTILHECAHALTPGDKHGPAWRRMAHRLGCVPSSTGRASTETRERLNSVAPWVMMYNDEVIRVFHKRPTRTMQKLPTLYLRGRRTETRGRLRIVPNPEFKG